MKYPVIYSFISLGFSASIFILIDFADFLMTRSNDEGRANKQQIVLLDHNELKIDSTIMSVWYIRSKKNGNEALTADYFMTIHYTRPFNNTERGYPFELSILDSPSIGWQNSDSCVFHFSKLKKEYKILLNQKNPDTVVGWLRPIITDTLSFKRILNR
jgi:hypothetical protein